MFFPDRIPAGFGALRRLKQSDFFVAVYADRLGRYHVSAGKVEIQFQNERLRAEFPQIGNVAEQLHRPVQTGQNDRAEGGQIPFGDRKLAVGAVQRLQKETEPVGVFLVAEIKYAVHEQIDPPFAGQTADRLRAFEAEAPRLFPDGRDGEGGIVFDTAGVDEVVPVLDTQGPSGVDAEQPVDRIRSQPQGTLVHGVGGTLGDLCHHQIAERPGVFLERLRGERDRLLTAEGDGRTVRQLLTEPVEVPDVRVRAQDQHRGGRNGGVAVRPFRQDQRRIEPERGDRSDRFGLGGLPVAGEHGAGIQIGLQRSDRRFGGLMLGITPAVCEQHRHDVRARPAGMAVKRRTVAFVAEQVTVFI